ncbi:GH16348 [Drosophila grimshawi]|uniref:GH16348 n=1 Tax=Drosophila grimshawi TaxID=7222 RepID=B4IYR8_DROGR|nr:GH16348 [Drosophila grimshawi]
MNKLLVLVACVLGTVSAGRILQRDLQRDLRPVDQRIERLSWQDLQRQKFILDIVQRVQQPLQQDDLIQLDQGLIVDAQRYNGGIDEDIQRVIDLDRQRRLLDEHQIFSILDVGHVQQLRGIYSLLVRAIDFETLQRNVVYLRRNINPVLLINSLSLAIRDREDTQALIIPAVQELLPELYLNQQTIDNVQRKQLELNQSKRPSLLDLLGRDQRIQLINPLVWRDLRLQLALRRQQIQQTQYRLVLPVQATAEQQDVTLLTEDIGMRNFIQNLIQELALFEDNNNDVNINLEKERRQDNVEVDNSRLLGENRRRAQQQQNIDNIREQNLRRNVNDNEDVQSIGRVPLLRNIGVGLGGKLENYVNQLPTVDINSDRLLPVGRRRQNVDRSEDDNEQLQSRYEGLRIDQEQAQNIRQINKNGDNVQQLNNNLQAVPRDDDRLVHINRRRVVQPIDNIEPRRINPIGEGRRVVNSKADEDIEQLIRSGNRLDQVSDENIAAIIANVRNLQRKEQNQQQQQKQEKGQERNNLRKLTDNLQSVPRDNERLVVVNRRRLNQPAENLTPRRINPIGEGRRVDDVNPLTEENILHLIRSDNRLGQLDDGEIIEMLRQNRQRKEQTQHERLQQQQQQQEQQQQEQQQQEQQQREQQRERQQQDQQQQQRQREREQQQQREREQQQQLQQQQEQDQERNNLRNSNQEDDILLLTDNLQSVPRNDERLVHINRRRLNQPAENLSPRRINPIGEGRRVDGVDPLSEEDIMQLIRNDNRLSQLSDEEIIAILRRNRQRKIQGQEVEQGRRNRRSLDNNVEERESRRGEVLLQTLRQLLARINQERISERSGNDRLINNSGQIQSNQDQAQRNALRLNEKRIDSRNNRVLLEQINIIESRLQQVIGLLIREVNNRSGAQQIDQQVRIESVIGNVLLGRLGDIGILRIIRELLQDSNVQTDRLGLGVKVGDRVLQHTLRRIINIVDEQRDQQLGAYQLEQLVLPDVKINDIRVSKLRTRIEDNDLDVNNLLEQPQQAQVIVRQRRLNNKPFTIDIDISSKRAQDVIVRVFLGPRQDVAGRELTLEQGRSDFLLLDAVNTQLQSGGNRIQLRSTDIAWTTPDATPYSEIYRQMLTTLRGQQQEQVSIPKLIGENGRFPQRLLLPRGRVEGLPMQLFVIVSPKERLEREQSLRLERIGGVIGTSRASLTDSRPLGYPLDRRIVNEQELLQLPNVQVQEVVIVHDN